MRFSGSGHRLRLALLSLALANGLPGGESATSRLTRDEPGASLRMGTPAGTPTPGARARTRARRVSRAIPDEERLRRWIHEARQVHPYAESEARMLAVLLCESGGNARAVNPAGPYLGLFQYHPRTWSVSANPYRAESVFDARAQIFATASAWSLGRQGEWGCFASAAPS